MTDQQQTEKPSPSQRWEALKARGNPTVDEINRIDHDTPWSEVEPAWWLEMMQVRRELVWEIKASHD